MIETLAIAMVSVSAVALLAGFVASEILQARIERYFSVLRQS